MTGPQVVASYTEHVLRVAAHLVKVESQTGRLVTLAIEPEPHCFLETTDETVAYFTQHLYTFHKAKPLSRQLEIETYTWDVLPDHLKTGDIVEYVCREIEWVKQQLVASPEAVVA